MRRAKIVCTIGPATASKEMIEQLVEAGMDCARLNFSHGDHKGHAEVAKLVRDASGKFRRPLSILADLCGPKMRIGTFASGAVQLEAGQAFTLTTESVVGDASGVSVSYADLPKDVRTDDAIFLNDGLLRLRVEEAAPTEVRCRVEVGGRLSDRKGMNMPGVRLSTPSLTEKDRADLKVAVEQLGVDYLALSFVRTPEDVAEAQKLAEGTPVIAKLEKPEGLENLEAIADTADGIMVARGDLGVELGAEKVPLIQKRIIRAANRRGKLVITATDMLDSMIRNPRPTRAEAADVANAVMDGTDALMLSGETASGSYPIEAVRMMDAIVCEVERAWLKDEAAQARDNTLIGDWDFTNAATRAAALMSRVLPLKAIVSFTRTGRSGRLLSDYRPMAPVVAVTSNSKVAQRLALYWGIVPRVEVPPDDTEETLRIATSLLVREKLCGSGDAFALVAPWPASGHPNTVKLHRLG